VVAVIKLYNFRKRLVIALDFQNWNVGLTFVQSEGKRIYQLSLLCLVFIFRFWGGEEQ